MTEQKTKVKRQPADEDAEDRDPESSSGQAMADLNFQDRLEEYSKASLVFLIDHLTSYKRNRRGWLLKYLRSVEEVLDHSKADSLQDSIMEAIRNERLAQDCQMGPVGMRPMRLDSWTHNIKQLADIADIKAKYGQRHEAMKRILQIAAEAVAALEDRIDAEAEAGKDVLAEAIKQVTDKARSEKREGRRETAGGNPSSPLHQPHAENKTADDVGAPPAVESESSNN